MSLGLPCCLMDPPTNDLPHLFWLCPFPLASHWAPVHSHSWSWEVESFQGVRTKGPPPTSTRGKDLAGSCISMHGLSLRIPLLPWSERPRNMWSLGVKGI